MIAVIVAYNQDRVIGKSGSIPWNGKLPADMEHFRRLTMGNTVVMGRKTWDSIPTRNRPLPGRHNIVISRHPEYLPTVDVYTSVEDVITRGSYPGDLFVIGGSQIYRQFLERVDKCVSRLYVTEVRTEKVEGDAYFLDRNIRLNFNLWREVARDVHEADKRNKYPYSFVTYERK